MFPAHCSALEYQLQTNDFFQSSGSFVRETLKVATDFCVCMYICIVVCYCLLTVEGGALVLDFHLRLNTGSLMNVGTDLSRGASHH